MIMRNSKRPTVHLGSYDNMMAWWHSAILLDVQMCNWNIFAVSLDGQQLDVEDCRRPGDHRHNWQLVNNHDQKWPHSKSSVVTYRCYHMFVLIWFFICFNIWCFCVGVDHCYYNVTAIVHIRVCVWSCVCGWMGWIKYILVYGPQTWQGLLAGTRGLHIRTRKEWSGASSHQGTCQLTWNCRSNKKGPAKI
jgi:hypothetical protein